MYEDEEERLRREEEERIRQEELVDMGLDAIDHLRGKETKPRSMAGKVGRFLSEDKDEDEEDDGEDITGDALDHLRDNKKEGAESKAKDLLDMARDFMGRGEAGSAGAGEVVKKSAIMLLQNPITWPIIGILALVLLVAIFFSGPYLPQGSQRVPQRTGGTSSTSQPGVVKYARKLDNLALINDMSFERLKKLDEKLIRLRKEALGFVRDTTDQAEQYQDLISEIDRIRNEIVYLEVNVNENYDDLGTVAILDDDAARLFAIQKSTTAWSYPEWRPEYDTDEKIKKKIAELKEKFKTSNNKYSIEGEIDELEYVLEEMQKLITAYGDTVSRLDKYYSEMGYKTVLSYINDRYADKKYNTLDEEHFEPEYLKDINGEDTEEVIRQERYLHNMASIVEELTYEKKYENKKSLYNVADTYNELGRMLRDSKSQNEDEFRQKGEVEVTNFIYSRGSIQDFEQNLSEDWKRYHHDITTKFTTDGDSINRVVFEPEEKEYIAGKYIDGKQVERSNRIERLVDTVQDWIGTFEYYAPTDSLKNQTFLSRDLTEKEDLYTLDKQKIKSSIISFSREYNISYKEYSDPYFREKLRKDEDLTEREKEVIDEKYPGNGNKSFYESQYTGFMNKVLFNNIIDVRNRRVEVDPEMYIKWGGEYYERVTQKVLSATESSTWHNKGCMGYPTTAPGDGQAYEFTVTVTLEYEYAKVKPKHVDTLSSKINYLYKRLPEEDADGNIKTRATDLYVSGAAGNFNDVHETDHIITTSSYSTGTTGHYVGSGENRTWCGHVWHSRSVTRSQKEIYEEKIEQTPSVINYDIFGDPR